MAKASEKDKQPTAQLLPPPRKLKEDVQQPSVSQAFKNKHACKVGGERTQPRVGGEREGKMRWVKAN